MPDLTQLEFKFDPNSLATPRKLGISAYMRIKNEAEFLRLVIESHIEFYDEIVAVYNDCTDNTEAILLDLQKQYPHKIRVFHYLPKVHPTLSVAHKNTPADSVHSMANYYNYALSKTTYRVAVKLDGDHLAIPCNLAPLLKIIRADSLAEKQKIYTFSGVNLIRESGELLTGGKIIYPFSGQGDIMYHPVSEKMFYRQGDRQEKFVSPTKKQMEREYMGIMYFHLKYLKQADYKILQLGKSEVFTLPFTQFCSPANLNRMRKLLSLKNQLRCFLYRYKTIRRLKYRLTKEHPRMYVARLLRLEKDLQGINFQHDVVDKLGNLTFRGVDREK